MKAKVYCADEGADMLGRLRTAAAEHLRHAARLYAMADRIEYFRRTSKWLYPHEAGYRYHVRAARPLARWRQWRFVG